MSMIEMKLSWRGKDVRYLSIEWVEDGTLILFLKRNSKKCMVHGIFLFFAKVWYKEAQSTL